MQVQGFGFSSASRSLKSRLLAESHLKGWSFALRVVHAGQRRLMTWPLRLLKRMQRGKLRNEGI